MSPFEAPLHPQRRFVKLYISWLDSRIPTAHYEQKNATSPEISVGAASFCRLVVSFRLHGLTVTSFNIRRQLSVNPAITKQEIMREKVPKVGIGI